MVLLCGDFDNLSIFVGFVEVFDAGNLRDFAACADRQGDRLQTFQLDFEDALDEVIVFDWRDFDCDFDLRSLFLANFEANLFEIFEPFVTAD